MSKFLGTLTLPFADSVHRKRDRRSLGQVLCLSTCVLCLHFQQNTRFSCTRPNPSTFLQLFVESGCGFQLLWCTGGVPGIGLVKKNDLNFMAGAQKRETNSSLSRDNGGHSGGYLPSPMDPKIANGLDAQVTPQLMGMSPDTEDLADSAWLNESADLDEIDIEELANGTTVLELVDLPGDAAEEPQVNEEAQVDTQGEVPSQPDLASDTVTTIDPSLPPQETSAPIQHEPAQPESTQPESAQPESAQPALAQPESLQPESVQPELTPEGMHFARQPQ